MSDTIQNEEYQAEYNKAMQALESAADGKQPEVITEPAKEEPQPTVETTEEPKADDPLELKKQLETLQAELSARDKALKDTQRAFHQRSEEAARLRREQEKLARKRPELLDSVPELEEVVKHVVHDARESEQERYQQTNQAAIVAVQEALPEAAQWLADPEFMQAMEARREAVGAHVFDLDPRVMVRELTAEKLARDKAAFESQKQAAIDAARRDFEKQAKAKASMTMPGAAAGAGRVTSVKGLSADDVMNMSDAEFKRLQSKTLGF